MSLERGEKIMCGVVVAALGFGLLGLSRGCGDTGEGSVKLPLGYKPGIPKGPQVPPAKGKKPVVQTKGIKDFLPRNGGVK